jgi:peptidyl-prolyl cis-trans isomerase SurA
MTLRNKQKRADRMVLRVFAFGLAAMAAMAVAPRPVHAQQVAVIVNGDPITTYDIEQRTKFVALTTHKTPSRQQVIEDLIDEKLKIQVGKRYKLDVTDADVDNAYAEMGSRMHYSPQQLTQALAQSGIDASTLKSRIRADITWQQIVRGKFQASLQLSEKDIILKADSKDSKVGYEYTLRPILFVVPRGSPESVVEGRKREAEALRNRFESCDSGLPFARALRDVAVREPIVKTSADLAPALVKILDETSVGKLTNPEITPEGVQVFALCAKKESKTETAAKREVRNEMFAEQFQAKAKRYLQELRKGAMIEVK